jgi:hypothetical protein
LWEELVSTIELTGDDDAMIWQFHSSGVYSSQSLYVVINFRGVKPVYLLIVWKLVAPPQFISFYGYFSKTSC